MPKTKELVNYETMDRLQLVKELQKKDTLIMQLKTLSAMYDGHPNEVIDMHLDALICELASLFKIKMDDMMKLSDELRLVIKRFISK
jgi:hypothetical protein